MTDIREALVARQREEYGESWDVLVPEVGWTLGRIIESVIEDALAEFDVTPRGVHNHDIDPACPETRLPDGSLRGECTTNVTPPTVKPTLEQVVDVLAAQPPGRGEWTSSRIMQTARAVLALLPGRSEAEVREGVLDALRPEYSDLIPTIRARIARGEGS